MFHVVFRIFYQLLTSLYRPECVNHVSKSWLFLCCKEESIFGLEPQLIHHHLKKKERERQKR